MKKITVLKQLRLMSGFGQQEVAEVLKIERSTYTRWENKEKDLTLSQIEQIAKFYGLGPNALTKMMLDKHINSPDVLAGLILKKGS